LQEKDMGHLRYGLTCAAGAVLVWANVGEAQPAEQQRTRGASSSVASAVESVTGRLITTTAPLIDITKNPGCGLTGLTPAQKIERNRRLALYYFQASVEEAERDHKYTLASQGCVPDDGKSMWLYGAFTPPPAEPTMVDVGKGNEGQFIQNESRAWRSAWLSQS
jgi:hypothetical protein